MRLIGSWNDAFSKLNGALPCLKIVKVHQLDTASETLRHIIGFKSSADAKATTPKDLQSTAVFKGPYWGKDLSERLVVQNDAFLFPDGLDSSSDDSHDSEDEDEDEGEEDEDDMEVDNEE